MPVRVRQKQPAKVTKNTAAALEAAKLPAGKKADDGYIDWGSFECNQPDGGFEQRKIG